MKNKYVEDDLLKLKDLCQKEEVSAPLKSPVSSKYSDNPFKKQKEEKDSALVGKFEQFTKVKLPEKENQEPILEDKSTSVTPVKSVTPMKLSA